MLHYPCNTIFRQHHRSDRVFRVPSVTAQQPPVNPPTSGLRPLGTSGTERRGVGRLSCGQQLRRRRQADNASAAGRSSALLSPLLFMATHDTTLRSALPLHAAVAVHSFPPRSFGKQPPSLSRRKTALRLLTCGAHGSASHIKRRDRPPHNVFRLGRP